MVDRPTDSRLTRLRGESLLTSERKSFGKLTKLAAFYLFQALIYGYVLYRYTFGDSGFFQEVVIFELGSLLFYVALHGMKYWISYFDYITLATESSGKNTRLFLFWDVTVHLLRMVFQLYSLIKFTIYYNYPVFWARDIFISLITSFEFVRKFWLSWKYVSQINSLQTEDIKHLGEECGICLQKMEVGTLLSCNHYFHRDCLINWIHQPNVSKNCPVCRAAIRFDQENKEKKNRDMYRRMVFQRPVVNRNAPEVIQLERDAAEHAEAILDEEDVGGEQVPAQTPTPQQRTNKYLKKSLVTSNTIDQLLAKFRSQLEYALPHTAPLETINFSELVVKPFSSRASPDLTLQRNFFELFSKEDSSPIGCPSSAGGIDVTSLEGCLNSRRFEIMIEALKLFYFKRKLKQTKLQSTIEILSSRLNPAQNPH